MGVREMADGSVVDPALTQRAAKRQAAKGDHEANSHCLKRGVA